MSNVYKVVTFIRLMTLQSRGLAPISPCGDLMSVAERYDLKDIVMHMLVSGVVPSKTEWKTIVCKVVNEKSMKRWQYQCLLYRNLYLYKNVI